MFLKCIAVFLLSMVPFIELRGGVILGVGMEIPYILNYIICIIGNMVPVPFIMFFARRFLLWTIDCKPYGPFMQRIINLMPKKMGTGTVNITKKFQNFWGSKFKKIMNKAEQKAA
ncbi:MAG: small multi-drug export protein, partial [Oscillospiraceae bacterium]